MNLNLEHILNAPEPPELKTEKATYYTRLRNVGSSAFLHTIFAPPEPSLLDWGVREYGLPEQWKAFLRAQNGADIFLRSIFLYGVIVPGTLFDRGTEYTESPVSLSDIDVHNDSLEDWVQVGSYGYDASRVMIHWETAQMRAVARRTPDVLAEWQTPWHFFTAETERLSLLYHDPTVLLPDGKYTIPNSPRLT